MGIQLRSIEVWRHLLLVEQRRALLGSFPQGSLELAPVALEEYMVVAAAMEYALPR